MNPFDCPMVSRRGFLAQTGLGLGGLLLGGAGQAGETVLPGNVTIGIVLLWIAALLTLYTGYDYFKAGIRHVVELDD